MLLARVFGSMVGLIRPGLGGVNAGTLKPVSWEAIVYVEKRKKAAVYKTRPIMPRTGATGDAGGAAGGKARSTEAQTNTRGLEYFTRPEKGSLDVDSKLFSKVQIDSKRGLG
jgi:hypothetical protein